jgi:hypothetical protein
MAASGWMNTLASDSTTPYSPLAKAASSLS